jgi:hypothetical protein
VADAWGGSFGVAWGDAWGAGVTPPTPDAPVTTAGGRRSSGTQYRAKTLSRELREKEREDKRRAKELHRLAMVQLKAEGVTKAIGVKQTRSLLEEAFAALDEEPLVNTSGPELQPAVNAIVAWIVARALERQRLDDEDEADIELLLLAAL